MAKLKDIRGTNIQSLASDPPSPVEGQLWYNTTARVLKGLKTTAAAAWASGGNMPKTRAVGGGFGTQTANLFAGGLPPPSSGDNEYFLYDGSSWTSSGNIGTARYGMGASGTQTAGLIFGGYGGGFKTSAEEFDGSSWTNGGSLNTARSGISAANGMGTQTAGLAANGYSPGLPPGYFGNDVEEYNGSSWTTVTATPGTSNYRAGCGTQTAALVFGGSNSPPGSNVTLEYDGSSWTSGGNLNTGVSHNSGGGIQTAAINFGGRTGPPNTVTNTELYDGSSWTASTALSTSRMNSGGGGTQTSSICSGGRSTSAVLNNTEEFTGAAPATVSIDTD